MVMFERELFTLPSVLVGETVREPPAALMVMLTEAEVEPAELFAQTV